MTKPRLIWLIVLPAIVLAAVSWSLRTRHAASSLARNGMSSDDRLQFDADVAELEAPPAKVERSPTVALAQARADQPCSIAGIVVDDSESPVPRARIVLDRRDPEGLMDSFVRIPKSGTLLLSNSSQLAECTSDELGHFAFEVTSAGGTLVLNATHEGATDPAWSAASPGEENARLVLHMAGSMHVRILLPGDEVLGGLNIEFSPRNWSRCAPSISTDGSGRLVTEVHSGNFTGGVIGSSGSRPPVDETDAAVELGSGQCAIRATLPRLAPDEWSVSVGVDTQPGPIAIISGLIVDSHAWTEDLRVNPLDLRSMLALVKLGIEDPSGARIPAGLLRFRSDRPKQSDTTRPFAEGASSFYARIGAELDVSAPGFCTQRVIAADGARTIVLQPGKRVRLVLDGAGVPAPPLLLRVALLREPVANDKHAWFVVDTQDEARIADLAARSTIHWYGAGQFDGSGSAEAKVEGPGEYYACWYVGQHAGTGDSIRIVRILPVDPARIVVPESPEEAIITIHLDPGDLAAAIERW